MKNTQLQHSLLLLLTACIWGVAFVAQSVGMDYIGPFTFNSIRSFLGGIALLPVIFFMDRKKMTSKTSSPAQRKTLLTGGILCGLLLAAASSFQQIGIMSTSVGKAGFITAFYIILVPVFSIFIGRKCPRSVWIAVGLALIGLYLLCINGDTGINTGDILVFICAILFSFHILVIDHFSPMVDGVKMSCIQFFVCGIVCAVPMLAGESPNMSSILEAWMPILYAGIMSCGVAYTLQIVGQKGVNPTVASLILSMESCISVLAGWLILGQQLTPKELLGCAVMFAAILLAQLVPGTN